MSYLVWHAGIYGRVEGVGPTQEPDVDGEGTEGGPGVRLGELWLQSLVVGLWF